MEGGGGMGRGGSGSSASAEFYLPDYRFGKTLGIGSFGKVKVAEHVLTGHKVAIKILNRRKIRAMDMEEKVRREIKIMRLFMHPHIIRLYEVIETPTDIFVVMEYMMCGELFDYIVEKGRLQEDEARQFFQQIVSGVEYSHRNMVVHRDLKPENLLLDSRRNVKIADFGFSNIMRDGHFLKTSCGSPNYAAPEVISGKLYAGSEVDVWSLGVVLYALLCGSLPFDDENIPNLFKKIKGGIYTLPSHLSRGARDLIPRMLLVDPMKRATIPEIRQHPWCQAHLPRYLAVPPLDTNQLANKIDDEVLQAVIHMGFDKTFLVESLRNSVQNQATVAYYLMLDNRHRICNGYLEAEFQEGGEGGLQVAHMNPVPQNWVGRPTALRGFAPRSINSRHSLSPSGFQGRVVAERNWALGLQFCARPREIMMEALKVLHELRISWKKLGNYGLKCRWVPPISASLPSIPVSQAHRSSSDDLMSQDSLGELPISPMISGSLQERIGLHERSISTVGSGDSDYSKGGEEHDAVKFEVQLYKVKDEKYLLDLQRLDGPYILFLDLCASFLSELWTL